MTNDAEMILPDDERAAKLVTVTGWVSRDGRFYGEDERIARYAGSTHSRCSDCGKPCSKNWLVCDACRHIRAVEKHAQRQAKPWDGICMIYSDADDRYFSEPGEIVEYLEDEGEGRTLADLQLLLCKPNYPRAPNPADYYYDEMPEDGEIPYEVTKAFASLAAALEKCSPLSWSPSKFALDLASLNIATDATKTHNCFTSVERE